MGGEGWEPRRHFRVRATGLPTHDPIFPHLSSGAGRSVPRSSLGPWWLSALFLWTQLPAALGSPAGMLRTRFPTSGTPHPRLLLSRYKTHPDDTCRIPASWVLQHPGKKGCG